MKIIHNNFLSFDCNPTLETWAFFLDISKAFDKVWHKSLLFKLQSVGNFFFLYWSPSSSLCTVFDSISFKIDEVLSINPSTNVFVFANFNIHHNDWPTYSGGTDWPGELCYNLKWPYPDGQLSYSDPGWNWCIYPS